MLDQESDHGVKADELAALFDDLFVQPEAKAVVFSQWTRTNDIVIRRLEARGLGYVSFHGGIPSEARPVLVERIRDDPDRRVFLSTDAGSTGLNLQHASILINMDLPWTLAILERRIARIHRRGQKRPVLIVNFIAKGTIEEGMLSVPAFKCSLSAGILDGGTGEISFGGSRLNRFMKDVENVTGYMGEGETMVPAGKVATIAATEALSMTATAPRPRQHGTVLKGGSAVPDGTNTDPWSALLQAGVQFISVLAAIGDPSTDSHPWIKRDPTTGVPHLKVPLPPLETVSRFADVLSVLADTLRDRMS